AAILAVAGPVGEARRVLGLHGLGDATPMVLGLVGAALALSQLLFALFLRGVALSYLHEALAASIRGFVILYAAFVASLVFLNLMTEAGRANPVLGPLSYLLTLAYVGMVLVLPLWLLRLLFQTHECINHPMAAS